VNQAPKKDYKMEKDILTIPDLRTGTISSKYFNQAMYTNVEGQNLHVIPCVVGVVLQLEMEFTSIISIINISLISVSLPR